MQPTNHRSMNTTFSAPKRTPHWRLVFVMAGLLLSVSAPHIANAAEATVILSQECEYLLLDSSQGQILMKIIEGEKPKPGDTLSGTLKKRDVSKLTVQRTNEVISAWIDTIDRSSTQALMRYQQYCN